VTVNTTKTAFGAILFFGLLAMTARTATDPDLWWHLKTGEWILQNGQIPHSDPFSFTRTGSPWISHEWLSEVVFYTIWRYTSWGGLIVFSAIVTTAGFMLLYLRCGSRPHWAAAATALGALASAPAWGVRPQMFTFLLVSVMLLLLERSEERPWLLCWIPLAFVVWLNLHAGFALALVLLLAWCAGLMWEAVTGSTNKASARPQLFRLLCVMVSCLALVPLNPSGIRLYRYPLDVVRSGGMRSFIVEWASPDFHQGRYAAFLLMCLVLVVSFAASNFRPKARVMVPLTGTLLAGLDAVRHIPIFVLFAVPVIARSLPNASNTAPTRNEFESRRQRMFVVASVVLMMVFCFVRWGTLIKGQGRSESEMYPKRAVDYMAGAGDTGRLFAYYDWGGYSIWRLDPATKVFVDGRADLYGDEMLDQFKAAMQLRAGWHEILERWRVETVLIPSSSALAQALALDTDWRPTYQDSQAAVFRRAIPETGGGRGRKSPSHQGKKVQKSLAELS